VAGEDGGVQHVWVCDEHPGTVPDPRAVLHRRVAVVDVYGKVVSSGEEFFLELRPRGPALN
jgi:hypothetical protein